MIFESKTGYGIHDLDVTAPVLDYPLSLQGSSDCRYAGPPYPDHAGQQLLRHRDVHSHEIVQAQDPSAHPLLNSVNGVACRRLLDF